MTVSTPRHAVRWVHEAIGARLSHRQGGEGAIHPQQAASWAANQYVRVVRR